ncbi:hypothetical protein [Pseudolysinimonas sp.]|uniref:hypothetical protein n=1 Tax=Pseudolysinimonas sp. TaxID=2680009 RepID=UPI003F7E073D
MADVTRSVAAPGGGDYSLILPGAWVAFALRDQDDVKRRVTALVRKQLGRADRLARQRREVTAEMLETARRAREAGCSAMYMALEILPGIPFPAAILAGEIDWPPIATDPAGGVEEALATGFPGSDIVPHRMGPAARSVEFGTQEVGAQTTPTMRAQFRIPYPDASRLLEFTVSTPMMVDADLWAALFDEIIDSMTWSRAARETANAAPTV